MALVTPSLMRRAVLPRTNCGAVEDVATKSYPNAQLMVNCWFGCVLRVPLGNNSFHKGIPGIQTTDPNQQLTMKVEMLHV